MANNDIKPMSEQDLTLFLNYAITGKAEENDVKRLQRIARRPLTMSDAVVVFQSMNQQTRKTISSLIERVQVLEFLSQGLGATEDDFEKARSQYDQMLEDYRKSMDKDSEKAENENNEEDKDNA